MVETAGAAKRGEMSRVTLVGEHRRMDIVLPADEPIGRLLPDVLRLVGDRVQARPTPRHLVTADGTVLPQDATLATAEIRDGAVLRVVKAEDVPAAPVVHDVTDEVAGDLDVRAWRWSETARRWTAGTATVALATTTAGLAARGTDSAALPIAAAAVLLGALAAAARRATPPLAAALALTAGALGTIAVWAAADAHAWATAGRLGAVAAVATGTLLLIAVCTPAGRGAMIGAGATAATAGAWEAVTGLLDGAHTADGQARLGAVLAVTAAVTLGVLPRLALVAAGLTRLDDHRSAGGSVSRHDVETALAATHRGLALATVVTAVSAGAAGVLAAGAASPWTVALTAVLAVVLLSRSRAYPLVAEVVALLAAALVLVVRLAVLWLDHAGAQGPVTALAAAALVPLGALAVRPPEHVRIRLRRAVDLAEAAGVIALLPLAVGAFGVYGRLTGAF
jgi:type VII secretion integral membrane protein EccD